MKRADKHYWLWLGLLLALLWGGAPTAEAFTRPLGTTTRAPGFTPAAPYYDPSLPTTTSAYFPADVAFQQNLQLGVQLGSIIGQSAVYAGIGMLTDGLGDLGAAAEGGAFSAIGSTGKVGQQWLADNLGGESQAYFNTTQGGRYVDQLVGDVANESKVGYQPLTPSIQLQISKDAELLNGGTFQSVNWHFFQSPVTGLGGPSQPLLNALQQNGINVIIH